jgi:hypothetical protein
LLELDITNALCPSELFGLRWKCFNEAASSMTVAETVYEGKIALRARLSEASPRCICRRTWQSNLRRGKSSRPTRLLKPSSSRIKPGDFWIRTTTASECSTSWQRTWAAEADVSGDSQNDRNAGSEEGHSEGRAGCSPTLPNGNDYRCLHTGDSRECAGNGQLHPHLAERKYGRQSVALKRR